MSAQPGHAFALQYTTRKLMVGSIAPMAGAIDTEKALPAIAVGLTGDVGANATFTGQGSWAVGLAGATDFLAAAACRAADGEIGAFISRIAGGHTLIRPITDTVAIPPYFASQMPACNPR